MCRLLEGVSLNTFWFCFDIFKNKNVARYFSITTLKDGSASIPQAGTVWCNCWLVRDLNMPFGGFKASGVGREGAKESYEFYTEVKTVCVKM